MKSRKKDFIQHLSHDIDDDKAEAYIDESLPLIWLVMMYFSALEKSLDSPLCETVSDRTDALGLLIIQKIRYLAKVDLFKHLCDDIHLGSATVLYGLNEVITGLSEVGKLRYLQFSLDSLDKIIGQIQAVRDSLYDYWECRSDLLQNWSGVNKEMPNQSTRTLSIA